MATVTFANLDQLFDITNSSVVAFSGFSGALSGFEYSYVSTGGHDWEFDGVGITTSGGVPTGGTVNSVQVDLDDDAQTLPEIVISGLGGIAATAFGIGSGSADQQRDKFWIAALGGADTFDFTGTEGGLIAGDGANVSDGGQHVGANDNFLNSGLMEVIAAAVIFGDYVDVNGGSAQGGDDLFTVNAPHIFGDFDEIAGGASGAGGDDVITPGRLDGTISTVLYVGDAGFVTGLLVGGDDLIDLRSTFIFTSTLSPILAGDLTFLSAVGTLRGGSDTIHGSSFKDTIYGDHIPGTDGAVVGGNDQLFGYGGRDTIFGNAGNDLISGGDDHDMLDGGLGADSILGGAGIDQAVGDAGSDTISGGDGTDILNGGAGADSIYGGNDNDTLFGDAQADRIFGEGGDDTIDAGTGNDVVDGGTQKDRIFGGSGADSIIGGGGNDILQGGNDADTLLGGAAFDVLEGGDGDDSLVGGDSNDVIFGNAGNDTILFNLGDDVDTIRDFTEGAGLGDVIRLVGFGAAFDTFAEILAVATDDGLHTTINLGGGDVLILRGVLVSQLAADDFVFG